MISSINRRSMENLVYQSEGSSVDPEMMLFWDVSFKGMQFFHEFPAVYICIYMCTYIYIYTYIYI